MAVSRLAAGFIVQLVPTLFVTAIGIEQMKRTAGNLKSVIDAHMRKQYFAKAC